MKNEIDPVRILEQLIEFSTYQSTPDKVAEGMRDCSSFLSNQLNQLGFSVRIDDLCSITAEREFNGEKTFLINTHFDTVPLAKGWEDTLKPTCMHASKYMPFRNGSIQSLFPAQTWSVKYTFTVLMLVD